MCAEYPEFVKEEEFSKKEAEIIKECLEPQIRQDMESLLQGVKCPLSIHIEYDEECGVSVKVTNPKDKENKKDVQQSDRQHVHRSGSIGFIVKFPDGTIVQRSNAKDTLIATLKVIGLNRVAAFRGRTFAGIPLVSRNRRMDGENKWQEEIDGWYVYVNMSNNTKIDVLRQLSDELRLGFVIKNENGDDVDSNGLPQKGKRQMFSIDGNGSFNKRNCVLETVRKYMRLHPNATSQQLMQVFPPEVQGGYGVVRSISWVQQQQQLGKDFMGRYFMNPDSRIRTCDGGQLLVSNQWGDQFHRFVDAARNVGIEIKEL